MIKFVREHWRAVGIGVALLVGAGSALAARCRPAPAAVEARMEASHTTDTAQRIDAQGEVETAAHVVREAYRPDGTVRTRTIVDKGSKAKTSVQTVTVVKEVEKTKTVTVTEPYRPAPLAISVVPAWDTLRLKPTEVTAQADFPIGNLLGVELRAGPSVRWTGSARPDAYGVVLRGEIR